MMTLDAAGRRHGFHSKPISSEDTRLTSTANEEGKQGGFGIVVQKLMSHLRW